MKQILFEAAFGDERKQVEISQPHGTGQQGLHIYVDKYYCGTMGKRGCQWIAHLNNNSLPEFTSTDIEILGQIIEESKVFDL
jgi:hypothetical protein